MVARDLAQETEARLVEEGYAQPRGGSGTFVSTIPPDPPLAPHQRRTDRRSQASRPTLSSYARRVMALAPLPAVGHPPREGLLYDFRYGVPAVAEFPQDTWTRLVMRRSRRMTVATLRYGRARGFLPLRQAIAEYLTRARGVAASFEQVVIVNGSQQALDLVARLLLDPSDRVAIEEPSYVSARHVFLAAGARLVPVPVDRHGMDVSRLPRGEGIRLAYVTPSHQFPLGSVLPLERRLALLSWAEKAGALIVEDDYDSEFWYGRPVEAIQGLDATGRVIYVGTFSKVLFPSLRLGYLVLPESLVPAVAALKFLVDRHAPVTDQEIVCDFLTGGHFERHARRARARNAGRRAAMLEAFRDTFGDRVEIVGETAGIHMVIWLRDVSPSDLDDLITRAADHGVGIYSVAPHYMIRPPRRGCSLGTAA